LISFFWVQLFHLLYYSVSNDAFEFICHLFYSFSFYFFTIFQHFFGELFLHVLFFVSVGLDHNFILSHFSLHLVESLSVLSLLNLCLFQLFLVSLFHLLVVSSFEFNFLVIHFKSLIISFFIKLAIMLSLLCHRIYLGFPFFFYVLNFNVMIKLLYLHFLFDLPFILSYIISIRLNKSFLLFYIVLIVFDRIFKFSYFACELLNSFLC
jgi:hypothetical protein